MIYEIADLRIRIENRCSFTTEFCKEYFSQIDGTFDLSAKVSKAAFAEEKHPKKAISKYKKWLKICDFTAFYPYFNNLKIYFILVFWGIFGVQTSLILKFFCFS